MPPFEFHADDYAHLRRTTFAARIPSLLSQEGQHRCRKAGEGMEFLDYRPYVPGDDLRYIDWSLYGRLRQRIVRVYENPENLSITFLVDLSRSMFFGEPVSKAVHACRIACGLAYVALIQGERVRIGTFGSGLSPIMGPFQSRRQVARIVEYLQQAEENGNTRFHDCLKTFCSQIRRKGLVVILSDFLSDDGYDEGFRLVLSRGCKLLLGQVLDKADLGEGLKGYLRIRDSETGHEQKVLVDHVMRRRVANSAQVHHDTLVAWTRQYGQRIIQTWTKDDHIQVVAHMVRSGWGVR